MIERDGSVERFWHKNESEVKQYRALAIGKTVMHLSYNSSDNAVRVGSQQQIPFQPALWYNWNQFPFSEKEKRCWLFYRPHY